MSDFTTAFLSSTARDLQQHRDAVDAAIRRMPDFHCVRMEDFNAQPETAEEVCRKAVLQANVFVGLIGHLHGSRPEGSELSYTEIEVATAKKAGKPLLLFLAGDSLPVAVGHREPDSAWQHQQRFREQIRQGPGSPVVDFFEEPEALATKVVTALYQWKSKVDREIALTAVEKERPAVASEQESSSVGSQEVGHPMVTAVNAVSGRVILVVFLTLLAAVSLSLILPSPKKGKKNSVPAGAVAAPAGPSAPPLSGTHPGGPPAGKYGTTAKSDDAGVASSKERPRPAEHVNMSACACENFGTFDHPVGSCACQKPGKFVWPRPHNVTTVKIVACGGGGGGGQAGNAGQGEPDNGGGGGGGAGAPIYSIRMSGLREPKYDVVVGKGGAGGDGTYPQPGGDGEFSVFEGRIPFNVTVLDADTPHIPLLNFRLIFSGGFHGENGLSAFQGAAPGAGGTGAGAHGGNGHGPVSDLKTTSEAGQNSRFADGGRESGNCTVSKMSGGSGGGGGGGYEKGGDGGCGGDVDGVKPGSDGGRCAGGGGGGGYGENQIKGEHGGKGGDGIVLISWGKEDG